MDKEQVPARSRPTPQRALLNRILDVSKPWDIEGVPPLAFLAVFTLALLTLHFDLLEQSGVAGAFAVLWSIGLLFFAIGERVKILKVVFGGGLVVAFFGAAIVAQTGIVSRPEVEFIQAQLIGNRFLYFLLAMLVVSSVLSVSRTTLIRAVISYAPIIVGGLVVSALLGVAFGVLFGMSISEVLLYYFLPIMGGGTGAGAIPMSEVYADATGNPATQYFNHAIAVLTLGNITAILVAAALNQLGRVFTSLSGNGQLVRGGPAEQPPGEERSPHASSNTHAAMMFILCVLLSSFLIAELIGLIHLFAWLTILAIALNFSGLVSEDMKAALRDLTAWGMTAFLVSILVAFGLSADLELIAGLMNVGTLVVVLAIVFGAAVGAGAAAQLVRCYPIEGAITGGLCMANAGGSGDLQVLSAANRVELFPFAQISSRIGGAGMLILASYLFIAF